MRYSTSKKGTFHGWLLFFYSVPSRPVSSRMKIWRRLSKAGAIQLKGAVYILPMNEEHHEFFQWLVNEVASMNGEAAFTRVRSIDSMKDEEIMVLFRQQRENDYKTIGKTLDDIETRVNSIRKGSKAQSLKALSDQIAKVSKSFEEAGKKDFFLSGAGAALRSRIDGLNNFIRGLAVPAEKKATMVPVPPKKPEDYQGKIWISRKRPFVDRMASAWLIRKFIDRKATFELVEERDLATAGKRQITFDSNGGDFTHVGDLCTFETLIKSFGLKDKVLKKMAEIVHELDIKDDKYRNPEASGIELILSGLRRATQDDSELLEKGMSIFEMLYISKTG